MVYKLSVVVSAEARQNLINYQTENNLRTRDDAADGMLLNYPKLVERIAELEARIKDLEAKCPSQ